MTRDDERAEITRRTAEIEAACRALVAKARRLQSDVDAILVASDARVEAGLIGVHARLDRQRRRAHRRLA